MVVQGYLVAPWQAEDAQRESRLLVYVHVCHWGSRPTASALRHILDAEATCLLNMNSIVAELPERATCGRCRHEDGASQSRSPQM